MQFSLKTLLLIVLLAILVLYLWDIIDVTKADGGRDIHVKLVGRENEQIDSVQYATVRSRDLDDIMENFPHVETIFNDVTKHHVSVRVSWSSTTSRTGRLLDYGESFDTILFLVQWHDKKPEFRILKIPHFEKGNNLKLSL